jgi:2-amino-4-hydroxy-6-hydroxymethyldihydropteridine diphosphokinase
MTDKHQVYLGLGSNMGDRQALLEKAIQLISERVGDVTRRSSFIETEPWGFESPNQFLNAVILTESDKTPREVLQVTQQIEREMGRKKKSKRMTASNKSDCQYTDRPIDIDILLYDNLTIDEPDLKIPHPLMHKRDFVMKPLREICQNL